MMDAEELLIKISDERDNPDKLLELWDHYNKHSHFYSKEEQWQFIDYFPAVCYDAIMREQIRFKKEMREMRKIKVCVLPQPLASEICNRGISIFLLDKKTNYKGELLICSSFFPFSEEYDCGTMIALVNLTNCKKVKNMTADDWRRVGLPRKFFKGSEDRYCYIFDNLRRVIEMPVFTEEAGVPGGIFELEINEEDLAVYKDYQLPNRSLYGKKQLFDGKAVKKGWLIIIAIFVGVAALIYLIWSLLTNRELLSQLYG